MRRKKPLHIMHVARTLGALLLIGVLSLPGFLKDLHLFLGHEHEVCTRSETHFHDQTDDCEICALSVFPYLEVVAVEWEFLEEEPVEAEVLQAYSFRSSRYNGFKSSRAPPAGIPS